MKVSCDVSPKRRVTGVEERELLDIAAKLKAVEDEAERLRGERDQLIADLIADNARITDIAEILDLSHKAVRDARDRAGE